jgi:hypothetical protein
MTAPVSEIDEKLREWATASELALMDAIAVHGSIRGAADALSRDYANCSRALRALKARAAREGYAPGHFEGGVAPGYLMGKVTVQRGPAGVERTWERMSPDQQRAEETIRNFVEGLVRGLGKLAPITPAPKRVRSDLLAVYAFGDPHFGMKATIAGAGDSFDLAECDRITRAGIDRLVSATPPTGTALLLNAGDNTHSNDGSHRTPGHGNQMDMDGHHNDAVLVSAQAWAYAIRRMLEKHEKVIVWILPGNHDPDASFAISLALAMFFHNEPRVEVDLSRMAYLYLRFGKVLLGGHHGHGAKPADLPLLMAVDRPVDWGATDYRYVFMGHIHHDSVKEIQGVRIESLRTLAPKDSWHAGQGYRSLRDTRSIVYAADYGEIERHTCSAAMLQEAA